MTDICNNNFTYNKMFWLAPNSFFAEQLQNLFASDCGEIISFLQFSYQSFMLLPYGEKYGKIFERLANEDLLHAKQIAETIVMLSGKPEYKIPSGKFLGGRAVNTDSNISAMILADLELKESYIIKLKNVLTKIDNKFIKNLLNSILNEEQYHLNLLNNLKEENKL